MWTNNKLSCDKKGKKHGQQYATLYIYQFFSISNIQHAIQQYTDCCIAFIKLLYMWCHGVTLRSVVILTQTMIHILINLMKSYYLIILLLLTYIHILQIIKLLSLLKLILLVSFHISNQCNGKFWKKINIMNFFFIKLGIWKIFTVHTKDFRKDEEVFMSHVYSPSTSYCIIFNSLFSSAN